MAKLLNDEIDNQLIIYVCGKTNSGKTTLLNSLIDPNLEIEIFPANDKPETK